MAVVDQFAYGAVYPILAYGMSLSGCVLGLILATKARNRDGRIRRRLLAYATAALGGAGIWLPPLVTMLLGLRVPGTVLRYDPARLAGSFGLAILAVAAGLAVACLSHRRGRLTASTALLASGVVAANYATLWSLRFNGSTGFEGLHVAATVVTATAASGAAVWLLGAQRGLRAAAAGAAVVAATLAGTHFLATEGLRVEPGFDQRVVPGLSAGQLIPPVLLIGCLITTMLWYFTVGASTRADLQAVFVTPQHSIEIEPWMIADIRARVSRGLDSTDHGPSTGGLARARRSETSAHGDPTAARAEATRAGAAPAWRGLPAWGSDARPNAGRGQGGGAQAGTVRVDVRWQTAQGPSAQPAPAVNAPARRMPVRPNDPRPPLPIRVGPALAGAADTGVRPETEPVVVAEPVVVVAEPSPADRCRGRNRRD